MDLKSILTPELVALNLEGTNKEAIIKELVALAARSGKISDTEEALRSVFERERQMSTGMKHGIAIPHGKTWAVRELVACIGIAREPVDFDALDRQGCRIFIMTISPLDKTGPHLQFLAEVGLLFRSAEKREALLAARTPEEVISILTSAA
ncbi:MAG: PTS sugar transporter subunit IIA [Spirochaetaceae bacterium]|nr:PTS sugar transporter subunit IIA [Spirochaetaceae bacterium]